jgi:TadE-like protein
MNSRKRQRGQALVESALMLMIFLPVFIGIMDFGQFLYFNASLTERTRAAARWGAVNPFDAAKIANVVIYNDPDGGANGATPLLPYLQSTTPDGDAYVSATLTDAGTDDARIRVTITGFPYHFLIMPAALEHRTITDTEPYEVGR